MDLGQREMGTPSPAHRRDPGAHHLPPPAPHLLCRPPRLLEQPRRGLYVELSSSSYHLSRCCSLAAECNYEIFSIRSGSAHVSPGAAAICWWQQRGAAQLPGEL